MPDTQTASDVFYVIDFDSTVTRVEGLDELAAIALEGQPDAAEKVAAVRRITDQGMDGSMTFSESLQQRLALLSAHRDHLTPLVASLHGKISESFLRNKAFFAQHAEHIIVISSGFREFVAPIATSLGVRPENIYANEFTYDAEGNIVGVDQSNVLSENNGKVKLLNRLQLPGKVYVIGDGYTDYEIRAAGLADKFYAFTENVQRANVLEKADHIAPNLEEFLFVNKLPMSVSYPKHRIKVLLLENIHKKANEIFQTEGYQLEVVNGGLDEDELCERIRDVQILGIRSKTQVTARVLEHANRLMTIGAFCIGTNQIDLETCKEKGVAVFNAPYSNTRSVVELAISEMIALIRGVFPKSMAMHQGQWDKSAKNSNEIRGKKLGIIGYGNIGAQLSVLAEAMGMKVYFYDIVDRLALGNVQKCDTLEELLRQADVVTLHIDGRPENKNFFGAHEFGQMKDGAVFLNLARGPVVQIPALVEALKSGKLRGAGVDVFPEEPKNNDEPFVSELIGLHNVILTPHVGGSTEEAQFNIAEFVPGKIIDYINSGSTFMSVNFPNLQLPAFGGAHRLLHIHRNTPGVIANINRVLSEHGTNIVGQHLKTNETIGYVITDVDKAYDKDVIKALKEIPNTIKFRVLY
ncbi:phosphoglycerate dehydrogenase [Catalinimonas alkaloidigena]|nr:phosphoglycerate dehydrogenase [Catalinimonas alkaloidigena]